MVVFSVLQQYAYHASPYSGEVEKMLKQNKKNEWYGQKIKTQAIKMYWRVIYCGTRNMKTLMICVCVVLIKNNICIIVLYSAAINSPSSWWL